MKHLFSILLLFISNSSWAVDKPYESYDQIVDRLSRRRHQQIKMEVETSIPSEKFHVSLGLVSSSTNYQTNNIGSFTGQGVLLGAAIPLLPQQLYLEGNAQFYKNQTLAQGDASLHQFDLRLAHKEPLSFAILNLGAGLSTRFFQIKNSANGSDHNLTTPYFMVFTGLERRLAPRISLAGDLSYQRSFLDDNNGKNIINLMFRLNYHL